MADDAQVRLLQPFSSVPPPLDGPTPLLTIFLTA